MKLSMIIVLGLLVLGGAVFVVMNKPFEKKEGELTIRDLIEESKRRLSGTATTNDKEKMLGISTTPAIYEGTHLVSVPESDQELIHKGGTEVSFKTYVPSKIPSGFSLSPTSISHGVQYGATLFQVVFLHKNGDKVYVLQYPLKEYLTSAKTTLEKYAAGAQEVNVAGRKAYISYTGVTTARKYQFHQTITVVNDATLVRIEYAGEEKLSNADLTELGASLVK